MGETEVEYMIVCRQCLQAIESHEGYQIKRKLNSIDDEGFVIDDGIEEVIHCEWCKEDVPIDEAYEI